ncbi:Rcs stress response system protein RcsF [Pectobacterium cacticida]|uniref:Rcs stress response system protein RcsF n=1 Tax=Pectobacterium cacticida TaxID=69221 RepID=UPI003A8D0A40
MKKSRGILNACCSLYIVGDVADRLFLISETFGTCSSTCYRNPNQKTCTETKKPAPKPKPAARPAPAVLYQSAEQLVGKPFRDMGEVSGSSCQSSAQDSPPSAASARRRMQNRATALKANAVLLHECQTVSGVAGCYSQIVCQGTALKVSAQ